MANIGTFTAEKDGFTGQLRTLTLNVKVKLIPNDKGDTENAPDFRLQAAGPRHRRGVEEDQRSRAALRVRIPRRSFVPGDGLCPPDRERGRHARPDLVAQQAQGGLTPPTAPRPLRGRRAGAARHARAYGVSRSFNTAQAPGAPAPEADRFARAVAGIGQRQQRERMHVHDLAQLGQLVHGRAFRRAPANSCRYGWKRRRTLPGSSRALS